MNHKESPFVQQCHCSFFLSLQEKKGREKEKGLHKS